MRQAAAFITDINGCTYLPSVAKKKREKPKTLNGRLTLEDSSVFDDPVLVLIVMT